jgi:hypothetical protein
MIVLTSLRSSRELSNRSHHGGLSGSFTWRRRAARKMDAEATISGRKRRQTVVRMLRRSKRVGRVGERFSAILTTTTFRKGQVRDTSPVVKKVPSSLGYLCW